MSLPNRARALDHYPSPHGADANPQRHFELADSFHEALISLALDGTITSWDRAAEHIFGLARDRTIGASAFDVLPHLALDHLPHLLAEASRGRGPAPIESTRHDEAHVMTVSISAAPMFDGDDNVTGVLLLARDITEHARAREHQALLVQDLNHRVKNTMAIVHSMATQVFETRPSPQSLRTDFLSRLAALSRSHTLLHQGDWRGSSLHDVLTAQVAPHCAIDAQRCSLAGPVLLLNADAALALGMAVHELAANAAKYGAFSTPGGQVEIAWQFASMNGERHLQLSWCETGGPQVEPPQRRGLGSQLIERGLAYELGGEAQLHFDECGVRYVLSAPLAAMEARQ